MTTECNICLEDEEPFFACMYPECTAHACSKCMNIWILSNLNACCPGCRGEITQERLRELFGKKFVEYGLRKMREKILYQTEEVKFPKTQSLVSRMRADSNYSRQVSTIIYNAFRTGEEIVIPDDIEESPNTLVSAISKCTECSGIVMMHEATATTSRKFECGLCHKKYCADCLELLSEEHECSQEDRLNVIEILNSTKPCPKCMTRIGKIDGCDQMWCTKCHTAFSWITGKVELSRVHNPHYYEWRRTQENANPHTEIPNLVFNCNEIPDILLVIDKLDALPTPGVPYTNIYEMHRLSSEFNLLQVPVRRDNLDIRIKFLNGDMYMPAFIRSCIGRDRAFEIKHAQYSLKRMFIQASKDIFTNLFSKYSSDELITINNECKQLIEYYHTQYENIEMLFAY